MATTILGKRTRGADLPTKRTRRLTRSFREANDENQDPSEALDASDVETDAESEPEANELATFSPAVTRTPSARRTKSIYKLEAIEYRECTAPYSSFGSPVLLS